jgi:lipoate-protein ligase A
MTPKPQTSSRDAKGMLPCRLWGYRTNDGAHNMAADEVLLQKAHEGMASLRFYGWEPATVSLGYFQAHTILQDDPLLAGLPFVRRQSGGAALVHHHEVTYCLALPAGREWQGSQSWLERMHAIIAAALAGLGISARLHSPDSQSEFAGLLCFKHFAVGDVILQGNKVAGSAQRKQRGAILQQGAVLLAKSPYAPALSGVLELTGISVGRDELCQAIANQFAEETGWSLIPGDWSQDESRDCEELVESKYGQDAWNRKR